PDDMARRAEKAAPRFRRLKLKLGAGDGLDVERVRAVRAVTDLPLQVDVNEYWTVDETLDALPHLAGLGVEDCEQPLPEGDPGGEQVKAVSPIPIFVDEDCHTLEDVAACARRAHGINIKLSKSGGIREAIRMVNAARALGLGVMLGCMTEAGLGISAGAQIASLCDFIDLDGNLLLLEDPWPGVELLDGVQLPPDQPRLRVSARKALSLPRGGAVGRPALREARPGRAPLLAAPDSGDPRFNQGGGDPGRGPGRRHGRRRPRLRSHDGARRGSHPGWALPAGL